MSTQKTTGYIIALVSSLIALLAFFVMPYVSLGYFGSGTGMQIFSLVIQALQTSSATFNPGNNQATLFLLIILLPIVAVITTIIAGVQLARGARAGKAGATWLIILSGLILVGLVGLYIYLSSITPSYSSISITSLLGIGFWVNLLAMLAVLIGGILGLKTASPVVSQSWSQPQSQSWAAPQQQWPPSQPLSQPQQQWRSAEPLSQPQPWQQSQPQWPPSQPPQSSPQWPSSQQIQSSPQWPPSQQPQSSTQWPPSQQPPPRQ